MDSEIRSSEPTMPVAGDKRVRRGSALPDLSHRPAKRGVRLPADFVRRLGNLVFGAGDRPGTVPMSACMPSTRSTSRPKTSGSCNRRGESLAAMLKAHYEIRRNTFASNLSGRNYLDLTSRAMKTSPYRLVDGFSDIEQTSHAAAESTRKVSALSYGAFGGSCPPLRGTVKQFQRSSGSTHE
jgi:hypothetical protein